MSGRDGEAGKDEGTGILVQVEVTSRSAYELAATSWLVQFGQRTACIGISVWQ